MASAMITCLVLLILSLTVNVNSQTCHGISQYGQCSSNNGCGCLHLSFADDIGICALIGVTCSRLAPCQAPNDACEKADQICVRHPRCNSNPLCYPLSMIDQRLCPPAMTTSTPTTISMTTTTTARLMTSMITTAEPMTSMGPERPMTSMGPERPMTSMGPERPMTSMGPERPMTSMGPERPMTSMGPERPMTSMGPERPMTSMGPERPMTSMGPERPMTSMATERPMTATYSTNVISNYSSALTVDSEKYFRNGNFVSANFTDGNFTDGNFTGNHYFEAINILVNKTGYYTFKSLSNMDAYGYLYQSEFDPSNPSRNLLIQDDDSAGNRQFTFTIFLQADVPYTLVFTTFSDGQTGSLSVVVTGPDTVDFTPINSRQTTTTTTTLATLNKSKYSSALTINSGNYSRHGISSSNYYYEAIEVIVNTTGTYTFISKSYIDTFGYLYQGSFYPSYPSLNLRAEDDQNGGNNQFEFTVPLQAGIKYILVVTTYMRDITGPFSIDVTGPDSVDFMSIDNL